jgi:3-mercaptopyruvate sulfurtransferase SseA
MLAQGMHSLRSQQRTAADRSATASQGGRNVLMVSKLTPRQVVSRMVNGSSVSFVDARSERDWSEADTKIVGAVRAELTSLVRDAARVSNARLVVVYGAGERDPQVPGIAEALRACGFPEVRILSGGFEAWSDLHFAVQPAREEASH